MKKVLIALATLGAASVAFANGHYMPAPVAPNYFDGFVLGITGGVAHETGTVKSAAIDNVYGVDSFLRPDINSEYFSYTEALESDIGSTNLDGGILAGWGQTLNSCYYLGFELAARYAHASPDVKVGHAGFDVTPFPTDGIVGSQKLTASETKVNVDSDFSYSGALKGGYLITPKTMFYLLAGVEYTKFNVDVDHDFAKFVDSSGSPILSTAGIPNVENDYSFSKGKWSFMPGVGLETMLTNNLSLKAEYTYAWYGDISHCNKAASFIPAQSQRSIASSWTTSASKTEVDNLSRGLFTLGLSYHFNGV